MSCTAESNNHLLLSLRGQVPKGDSLRNIETVELIHETIKYIVQVRTTVVVW